MSLSDIIAILSLIISALTAGWTFHRDYNDRGILDVRLMFGDSVSASGIEKNKLFVFVTNVGKRDTIMPLNFQTTFHPNLFPKKLQFL